MHQQRFSPWTFGLTGPFSPKINCQTLPMERERRPKTRGNGLPGHGFPER